MLGSRVSASLVNIRELTTINFEKSMLQCGRSKDNDILCQNKLASRRHCMFVWDNKCLNVVDFASANGTYVNAVKTTPNVPKLLKNGDVVRIGCGYDNGQVSSYRVEIQDPHVKPIIDDDIMIIKEMPCSSRRKTSSEGDGAGKVKRESSQVAFCSSAQPQTSVELMTIEKVDSKRRKTNNENTEAEPPMEIVDSSENETAEEKRAKKVPALENPKIALTKEKETYPEKIVPKEKTDERNGIQDEAEPKEQEEEEKAIGKKSDVMVEEEEDDDDRRSDLPVLSIDVSDTEYNAVDSNEPSDFRKDDIDDVNIESAPEQVADALLYDTSLLNYKTVEISDEEDEDDDVTIQWRKRLSLDVKIKVEPKQEQVASDDERTLFELEKAEEREESIDLNDSIVMAKRQEKGISCNKRRRILSESEDSELKPDSPKKKTGGAHKKRKKLRKKHQDEQGRNKDMRKECVDRKASRQKENSEPKKKGVSGGSLGCRVDETHDEHLRQQQEPVVAADAEGSEISQGPKIQDDDDDDDDDDDKCQENKTLEDNEMKISFRECHIALERLPESDYLKSKDANKKKANKKKAASNKSKAESARRSIALTEPQPMTHRRHYRQEKRESRIRVEREYQRNEKIRKTLSPWAAGSLPHRKSNFVRPQLPVAEKLRRRLERKRKLQALAEKEKASCSKSCENDVKVITTKPIVKDSKVTRNDNLAQSMLVSADPDYSKQQMSLTKSKTSGPTIISDVIHSPPRGNDLMQSIGRAARKRNGEATIKIIKQEDTMDYDDEDDYDYPGTSSINDMQPLSMAAVAHDAQMTLENQAPPRVSILKNTACRKMKKSVTFKDDEQLKTVVEYIIQEENSLKSFEKTAKKRSSHLHEERAHLEEFLNNVYYWNPIWLKESKGKTIDPPIVSPETSHLPLKYNCYETYYSSFEPVHLVEMWALMLKEYKSKSQVSQASIVENSVIQAPLDSTQLTSLKLDIPLSLQEYEAKKYPRSGDLISFEYFSNYKTFLVFGYVVNVLSTVVMDTKQGKNPHAKVTLMVQTKPLNGTPVSGRPIAYQRIVYLKPFLKLIQALQLFQHSPLMDVILSPTIEKFSLPSINAEKYRSLDHVDLNMNQKKAILKVKAMVQLDQPKVCLIQGPPGTGKSSVIVTLITELLSEDSNRKILLCAPSNAAVDLLALQLWKQRQERNADLRLLVLRIGNNESMDSILRGISLESYVKQQVDKQIEMYRKKKISQEEIEKRIQYWDSHFHTYETQLQTSSFPRIDSHLASQIEWRKANRDMWKCMALGNMAGDFQEICEKALKYDCTKMMLKNANLIICTPNSCYSEAMEATFRKENIPICIVDQANQTCEAETLIPLMLGVKSLILVGDSNQLAATVVSKRAQNLRLDRSLFSRIESVLNFEAQQLSPDFNPVISLDTQYRINLPILEWPNRYFYQNLLKTHVVQRNEDLPLQPYKVFNFNTAKYDRKLSNSDVAEFVARMTRCIMQYAGPKDGQRTIGIITLCNYQKALIKNKIAVFKQKEEHARFETHVDVLDGFQGQEKDIVIMSCVGSEATGFLSDKQRLCVALTRAKQSLFLCGNFDAFEKNEMWRSLLKDAGARGVLVKIHHNIDCQELYKNIFQPK